MICKYNPCNYSSYGGDIVAEYKDGSMDISYHCHLSEWSLSEGCQCNYQSFRKSEDGRICSYLVHRSVPDKDGNYKESIISVNGYVMKEEE